ncbi:MAG: hypothetical protein U1F65_05800 [Verrucomicrobiota bacterium]
MSEKSLWQFRAKVWRDKSIPPRAAILLLNITDKIFRAPSEPFAMSSAEASRLCGLADAHDGAEEIKRLLAAGWLQSEGVKGCPPTNFYTVSNWGQIPPIKRGQTPPNKRGQTPPINPGQKPPIHISTSLREEMNDSMRKKSSSLRSTVGGGKKSSLRSEYGIGEDESSLRSQGDLKEFFKKHRKAAGLE